MYCVEMSSRESEVFVILIGEVLRLVMVIARIGFSLKCVQLYLNGDGLNDILFCLCTGVGRRTGSCSTSLCVWPLVLPTDSYHIS